MLSKNSVHTIEITGMGSEGEGVGKADGFAVFVPFALVGEIIEVLIVKALKNYAFGKIINIIKPSPHRVESECPYFFKCGGCDFWHADYQNELDYKTQKVADCLKRIGKIDVKVNETIGGTDVTGYRNKAQFPVTPDGIGFFAERSHRLIPIEKCIIQNEINDKILKIVRSYMDVYKIPAYDEKTHTGVIRHIFTRVGVNTGQSMVCIVTLGSNLPHKDTLIDMLKEEKITSIIQNINPKKTNVALGDKNITLYGTDTITDSIGDIKFEISPHSFFQINPAQTKVLYDKVIEFCNFKGNETVFDLYCGIGTISLYAAKYAKKVIGVECVPQAIENAKRNARINGFENAEFYVGNAEDMAGKLGSADIVIIDPPRKGCDAKLLESINKISPEKTIYVSCNPATLARDLNILQSYDYTVKTVQPVDMFHKTNHVECVVLITRVEK